MGVLLGIVYALLGIALIAMARSMTTLVHELGHAIPALLYTEEPVEVYVGNYGKKENTFQLNFGRLNIYLEFNMLVWYSGLCKHAGIPNTRERVISILMGPLASFLFGMFFLWIIVSFDFNTAIKTLLGIYILSSVIDFFYNIIPRQNPILLDDGSFCYNDGYNLMATLAYDKFPQPYKEAMQLMEEEKYEEAKLQLEALRDQDPKLVVPINHALLNIYKKEKNYNEAIDLYQEIDQTTPLNLLDYKELGFLFQKIGRHDKAIVCFNKFLYMNFSDAKTLNARAYSLLKQDKLAETEEDLTSAFNIDKTQPLNYLTRALLLSKIGSHDQVKENLLACLSLDEKYHEAHLELARYYESISDSQNAIIHYKFAREYGSDYHGIDYKLATLRERDF